jgi:hypothetical protein
MKVGIKISVGGLELKAEIDDKLNPHTARAILKALPIKGRAERWGDEIYFSIPVEVGTENPQTVVKMGDLAYWPPGRAFCIFFGPTPASGVGEIRPASPVNVFGKLRTDPRVLKKVRSGAEVRIERA